MNLKKSFSIYTLSSILSSAVPLLLLPILTRYLSEAEYGTIATLTTLAAFISPVLLWGITAKISVEYFKISNRDFLAYFYTIMRIPIYSFFVIFIVSTIAAIYSSGYIGISAKWLSFMPVFVMLTVLPQILTAMLRVKNNVMQYAYFEFLTSVTVVAFSIIFVVWLDLHWQGRMYAIAATSGIGTLIAAVWLVRNKYLVHSIFDKRAFIDALRFGAGLVPHDLGNQAIRLADRIFLVAMVGLSAAGQYAVAAQVSSVMLVLLSAFNRAWAPYLFSQLSNETPGTRLAIVKKSYLIVAGTFLFFVAFNLSVPLLYEAFVGKKFLASISYVFWLTLGYLFMAVYLTYIDYIFYVGKTHILSYITLFNLAINIFMNYLFIDWFGAIGAAYSFSATMFLVMSLAFVLSNKIFPMPWFYWIKRAIK